MNDFFEKPSAFRGPFPTAYTRLSTSTRNVPLAGLPAPVQDEIPISQLPLAGIIFGEEMVPIVQNGVTARTTVTSIVYASGAVPALINKTITLVYVAAAAQTEFPLSLPDHYGNTYPLGISNALHVTVDGLRLAEDDGTGVFGQYSVNIGSDTVTLLTPMVAGNIVVFDVFNINAQDITLASAINTQPLTVTATNVLSPLAFVANGNMTILYVNGRAFSDDSIPPSFIVKGRQVSWVDPLFSIVPGDAVIASYTYDGPGSGSGGGGGGGGGIPDAPVDGLFYGRKSSGGVGGWQQPIHSDITDWVQALLPYYPVSNPAGYVTAAAAAAAAPVQSVATRTGVITLTHSDITDWPAATAGFVPINDNMVINGNFAVNQRSKVSGVALAAAAYGHDRWKAGAGGCTYTFTTALPDTTITITAGTLTQIIEAGMIASGPYTLSWTGTAQARVYQGSPTGGYVASPLTTAPLAAGSNTVVEFNAGTVGLVKLEIGMIVTAFNRQSLAKSMADCQRYYQGSGLIESVGYSTTGATVGVGRSNPVVMRAAPTLIITDTSGCNNITTPTSVNAFGPGDVYGLGNVLATGTYTLNYKFTASAEL